MVKPISECVDEVREFLPDAFSDDGFSVIAMSGTLRFHIPFKVGPRQELTQWRCVYFRAGEFSQDEIVELAHDRGNTALIAFERTRSAVTKIYDIYKIALGEISKVITTSENESAPIE